MQKFENPIESSLLKDKVPWTLQQTFLVLVLTLLVRVVISAVLSGGGSSEMTTRLTVAQDISSAIVSLFLTLIIQGTFLVGPIYYAKKAVQGLQQQTLSILRILGFRSFPVWSSLGWVLLSFIGIVIINLLYQRAIVAWKLPLQTNDQVYAQMLKYAPYTTGSLLVLAVIVAPFCEELFFRSFVFMGLLRGMPVWGAMILSALVFALAHGDVGSFFVLFWIGIALAFLRWRTGSIWPGIILHLLNNSLAVLTLLPLFVH